jgi:hypothetical protein
MARKPNGKPVGRPEKPFDPQLFEQLCGIHCTRSEIASMMKICVDTLVLRVEEHYGEDYSLIYKRFQETGKCSVRRNQFALSKKNTAMAIWLGKVYLGQRDMDEIEKQNRPININIVQDPYKKDDKHNNSPSVSVQAVPDSSVGSGQAE